MATPEHHWDTGSVIAVNGPIATVDLPGLRVGEQVRLGEMALIGEVIVLQGRHGVVQVYEPTEGVRPGEKVERLGHPLSVELGPGLLGGIFDGVQRPLRALHDTFGDQIGRGVHIPALDRDKKWDFAPSPLKVGDALTPGVVLGTIPETESIQHRVLLPPDVSGELLWLAESGQVTVEQEIARVRLPNGVERSITPMQRWPVRSARPYIERDHAVVPLITGQRILDTFFPLLKGGKGAVPGPFGAGKTVVQQQIARWSSADIVIYVGCGERGNEMVDVLESFPKLQDPLTGRSLMERTLLVANTSNMPVVAREASIYVGVTIAEYYRDQGYDVVMVADSTSRWAEALREVAGRLGQMPVEEGYPAYLSSRLSAFYERAGRVHTLGSGVGSVTLIGAVSPPGGDFSEPVTSHTKEIVQTFWALSKALADARHYPSVDWNDSFSTDVGTAALWWESEIDASWASRRGEALALLAQAEELSRIVNLVGPEALSDLQRWTLEAAALIREGVLQQSALDPIDSYSPPRKQFALLDLMIAIHRQGKDLLALGVPIRTLMALPQLASARRLKSEVEGEDTAAISTFREAVRGAMDQIRLEYTRGEKR